MALQLEFPGFEKLGMSNDALIEKLRQLCQTPCPRGKRSRVDIPAVDDPNQNRWVMAAELGSTRYDRRILNRLQALASLGDIESDFWLGKPRFRVRP